LYTRSNENRRLVQPPVNLVRCTFGFILLSHF
jgi:hypothetical protein